MAGLWEIGYGIKGEILRKTTSRSQLEGSECKFHLRLWLGSHLCHSDGPYMSLGGSQLHPSAEPSMRILSSFSPMGQVLSGRPPRSGEQPRMCPGQAAQLRSTRGSVNSTQQEGNATSGGPTWC